MTIWGDRSLCGMGMDGLGHGDGDFNNLLGWLGIFLSSEETDRVSEVGAHGVHMASRKKHINLQYTLRIISKSRMNPSEDSQVG